MLLPARLFQRLVLGAAVLLASCSSAAPSTELTRPARPALPVQIIKYEAPQKNLQQNGERPLKAGDDFYNYVNNDWLKSYQLPADRASYGVTEEIEDKAEADVRAMIEALVAAKPAAGTLERKIADLYSSAMDEATIEKRGIEPLKPHLDRIRKVKDYDELVRLMGVIGYASPINAGIAPSPADPDKPAIWVSQGGLGMPHRGYYMSLGVKEEATRVAYRKHVATMMRLIGNGDPEGAAQRIYNLELKIARAHTDEDRSLSADEALRSTTLAGLKKFAPGFDWDLFFDEAGFKGAKLYVVTDGTAVGDLGELIHQIPLDDWKTWMEFHFANAMAPYLPKAFADSAFDFFSKELAGVTEKPKRWQFAVGIANDYLGDAVGQLYIKKYFPADHKQQIEAIVGNIRTAFATRMQHLDWMDEATRKEALNKLSHLQSMIGYPDKWRDYSALQIAPGKLFESVYDVFTFEWDDQVADLGKPTDRDEWPTPPHVVNAFYNPLANRFVLPAGILQPPFFDPDQDAAANYGGIGAVVGHEMSHGFDDRGRQFDETGKTRNWWTAETDDRFVGKSDDLIRQYNAYCPWFGACVNGLGTLGENIGDLSGVEIAYEAYHLSLNGKPAPVINGLTGDQRFFLAYAATYRGKVREELARALLDGDSHAPNRYRVNGVVRNLDAWYAAFNVKPGDRLYLKPEDRVRLW